MLSGKWLEILEEESQKDYYRIIQNVINSERKRFRIFPDKQDVFSAFELTPFENVKVVIIGQDPYHEENQAHGLAFSVLPGNEVPPSLLNIYKEIENEFGYKMPENYGYLKHWAEQGVFLLNTALTVREHHANSHKDIGYDNLIERIIKELNAKPEPVVWMLWGSNAKRFAPLINNPNHLVLKSVHPSPLSANRGGWFGNNHFKRCNGFLKSKGLTPIDWKITEGK